VLDVGHAGYRPLYGAGASAEPRLDERVRFEVAPFVRALGRRGLGEVPIFLELFYPFEADDAAVLANAVSSVHHCRAEIDRAPARST
jgi:hypothetical protein